MDPASVFSFPLDPFQTEACDAINRGENVLVCAKTGSGKTLVAEFQIHVTIARSQRIFYTTPIKSLSNQKYHDLKTQFPQASVGILTGDIKFCPDAQIVVMTTEILRNLLYKSGTATEHIGLTANLSLEGLGAVIFDECHYMNDPDRGHVWEESFILMPPTVQMILLSATLDGPEHLANWLTDIKLAEGGKRTHLIQTQYRVVPLQHALMFPDNSLRILCDNRGVFDGAVYNGWLQAQKESVATRARNKAITQAQGATDTQPSSQSRQQSLRQDSFIHRMNTAIETLQERNLLPALFFVLNRRACESYAAAVTHTLIDSSDSASVKHILKFHLSRHMGVLEKMPQFHTLTDLLSRGIGFHHSGLIPVLKEIVELLFSRGLIRLLFCTETFAVGLNMPTKTTLFAGLQKYDETSDRMRMLRADEYLQMAGRAGRRGKDTEGWAIYLPERDPVELSAIRQMMTGGCQAVQSRVELSCDLVLKTLLTSPTRALEILGKSYWARLRSHQRQQNTLQIEQIKKQILSLGLDDATANQLKERAALEEDFKTATPQLQFRKKAQAAVEQWKNRHQGGRWDLAWKNWGVAKKLWVQIEDLEIENSQLETFDDILKERLDFLTAEGFVEMVQQEGVEGKLQLTTLGQAASEVNEAGPMILPRFYCSLSPERRSTLTTNPNVLICLLSVFLEAYWKPDGIIPEPATVVRDANVPVAIKEGFTEMAEIARGLLDRPGISARSLALSGDWMELLWRWLEEGENPSVLCETFELFEGNFVRGVMKLGNILDEWVALAMLFGHTVQVEAVAGLRPTLARDFVLNDSLYLRLD